MFFILISLVLFKISLVIGGALALIPVIGYLGTWFFNGKQMKKEWSLLNEEEKKQEQLNGLKYMMPFIIVATVIFVLSRLLFLWGTP